MWPWRARACTGSLCSTCSRRRSPACWPTPPTSRESRAGRRTCRIVSGSRSCWSMGLYGGALCRQHRFASCGTSPVQCYSARVSFPARLYYPWHPGCGTDIDVQYREVRSGGEVVFICRVAGDSAAVIPARMFDPSCCARMVLGAPHTSVAALEEMCALLRELGFDSPATATHVRSQEGAHESETIVATEPSSDDATAAAPADGARGDARPAGARRRHRRTRQAVAGGRAASPHAGGRR